ncbi:MAG: opuBB, partial [Caulobacteraceae bacterium]|nr:opuBB [Caulobacteraceae bacterium]
SEQFILAQMMGDRLAREGARVRQHQGLGSAVIFRALQAGEIDAYVDYSGTLWTNVLGRKDIPDRQTMLKALTRELKARYGVVVLGPLGFENAYALAMKADRAKALHLATIADLAGHAPDLTLGGDLEFLSRPEWAALKSAYGLNFKAAKAYNPTFMYRALADGEADVISAFSSDGRIAEQHLLVLADPRGAIPAYDAVVLIAPKRADDARLRRALQPMVGAIAVDRMRQANLMIDRNRDKKTPAQAAAFLAEGLR